MNNWSFRYTGYQMGLSITSLPELQELLLTRADVLFNRDLLLCMYHRGLLGPSTPAVERELALLARLRELSS